MLRLSLPLWDVMLSARLEITVEFMGRAHRGRVHVHVVQSGKMTAVRSTRGIIQRQSRHLTMRKTY